MDTAVKPTLRPMPGLHWGHLLQRMAGGDEAALVTLYDEAGGLVFGLVRRVLRDVHDAEELTEEIFAQAWMRAGSFDTTLGSAAAWLLTMARNRAIDHLRQKRRSTPTESIEAVAEIAAEDDLEEQAGLRCRDDRLRQAVAALTVDQRRAIELAFFGGLSHAEVAHRLGLPVGTIKTRIRLGMGKLRVSLAESMGSEAVEGQ